MQRSKIRNPGWTAFDRKHRLGQGDEPANNVDPFPSISDSSPAATKSSTSNNFRPTKSFSAAVRPHLKAPSVQTSFIIGTVRNNLPNAESHEDLNVKLLKDVYSWADQQLIQDVLSGVHGDMEQASTLLKDMASPETNIEGATFSDNLSSIRDQHDKRNHCVQQDSSKISVLISAKLLSVPAEPEWEEDDIYITCRKDAMKIMRSATKHSRAASNAYYKGEHICAHQLSMRAKEERMVAENLNDKAAEEIFLNRNSKNDIWEMDLHGLHASEAVSALKNRLHTIESLMMMNCSASSGLTKLVADKVLSQPSDLSKDLRPDCNTRKPLPHQRQTILQVITGIGKHSKGQASLPSVIKSFLIENGYRFDEVRAGVLAVRPKFRNK
ncbi:hypothetical protein Cni_G11098 [Canna indica]|uniref:Smr domain-containing protein n=1 Tax=Canna indica TaxID=4628 RepID=A0AAQ3K604_9LILI|nr:hypothetical protein Cni_G11098 [Canna indica]